jgi:hypothetical protein
MIHVYREIISRTTTAPQQHRRRSRPSYTLCFPANFYCTKKPITEECHARNVEKKDKHQGTAIDCPSPCLESMLGPAEDLSPGR